MRRKYDFGGWATRNNLKCSDGRIIRHGAFKDCDGKRVPMVWMHDHNDPLKVMGHADLENRNEGVYAYGSFNDSELAQHCKMLIQHGDVSALSIYANQLNEVGGEVYHGNIREVSLVISPANPGARIDFPVLEHSDGSTEEVYDEAIITTGDGVELAHADKDENEDDDSKKPEKKPETNDSEDDETIEDIDEEYIEHAEDDEDGETIEDIFNTLNEKQKNVVYYLLSQVGGEVKHSDEEEEIEMKYNVFDNSTQQTGGVLSHSDMAVIFEDAKRCGSLKESVLAHMEEGVLAHATHVPSGTEMEKPTDKNPGYGVYSPDFLFPEARAFSNTPEFIKRDTTWVDYVMSKVHKSPFSRIKSVFADITEDEARARGYVKGKRKKEEVFTLLKRSTTPQTIYKKQKMDRDDIIDITDFDVVAWIRGEMRIMLNEELARAYLIGDGRLSSSDDKISEDHIRPVYNDDDLFTVKRTVTVASNADAEGKARALINDIIRGRKQWKGSGSPDFYTTEDWITEMLLIEDGIGHKLYKTVGELETALRINKLIPVEVMEGMTVDGEDMVGVMVNMADYNVGADKGGELNMFDDFDIDYNQYKYLLETRCSGALTKPFSAVRFTMKTGSASTGD